MSIMADNIRQHLKDMDSYISFLERENKRLSAENERLKEKLQKIKKSIK